jgi:hypothetical protein
MKKECDDILSSFILCSLFFLIFCSLFAWFSFIVSIIPSKR